MISQLRELLSFSHRDCKRELRQLIQAGLDDNKKILSLNAQILTLINQVQELKAINDYQTADLERKIVELETEVGKLKSKHEKKRN
jgi:hypothetical protein